MSEPGEADRTQLPTNRSWRTKRRVLAVLSIAVVFGVGAAAATIEFSGPAYPDTKASPSVGYSVVAPLASTVSYNGSSVQLGPIPAGYVATATAADAYNQYVNASGLSGAATEGGFGDPTVFLATYTNSTFGPVDSATGQIKPLYENTAVWVVFFSGVHWPLRYTPGGANSGSGQTTTSVQLSTDTADVLILVDPQTGQFLDALTEPTSGKSVAPAAPGSTFAPPPTGDTPVQTVPSQG